MQVYDQCVSEGNKWHVVMPLTVNESNTWKESVDFYFFLDEEARPRIQVVQFAEFGRTHARDTWKLSKTGLRKLTKEEKRTLVERSMHVVSYYATVEVIPPRREPLPVIQTPTEEGRELISLVPDAFSTMKVFTCPLDDRYGRWITVPTHWKALLVIQVWVVDRIMQMAVYGIGANWFKTFLKQGVPNGQPNAQQRAILEAYFEERARVNAGKLEAYFAGAVTPNIEVIGGLDSQRSGPIIRCLHR